MVYKIRNKAFNTFAGSQANPRLFISKKTKIHADLTRYVTVQVHITRYSNLRIMHNYRNISRAIKQFTMGDRIFEQLMIIHLKNWFTRPNDYEAPIENNWYLTRTMADILDRHYALFANNMHPMQLEAYESYNTFLRNAHSKATHDRMEQTVGRIEELAQAKEATMATQEGERIDLDDLQEIIIKAKGEERVSSEMMSNSATKTGEINDYLEVRRPFGAAL